MAKTIFVSHDGNSMSDVALRYAIDIAKGRNMKIKLVRIIPEIAIFPACPFGRGLRRKGSEGRSNL